MALLQHRQAGADATFSVTWDKGTVFRVRFHLKAADIAILKGLSKNRSYYNPEYRNRSFYYTGYEDYKKYPVRLGVAADSFTGESLNKFLESNEQDIRNFSRERLYAK